MAEQDGARREEIKRRCFGSCDADGDGFLKKAEMRTFAGYVGFDGTEEEWDEEYRKICVETNSRPAVGVPQAVVLRLLDDKSDTGCYCTNEEMMDLLGIDGAELGREAPGADNVSLAESEDTVPGEREGEDQERRPSRQEGHSVFFQGAGPGTDETALRRFFETVGAVRDRDVVLYRQHDGRSRGMGLVTYPSAGEAQRALASLDQVILDGCAISVRAAEASQAQPVGGASRGEDADGDCQMGQEPAEDLNSAGGRASGSSGPRIGGRGRDRGRGRRSAAAWGHGRAGDGGYGGLRVYDDQEAPDGGEARAGGRARGRGGADFGRGGRGARRLGGGGDGRTVFFGGVPFETGGDHLLSQFGTAGNVEAFWLFTRPDGRSRGMGLVRYQAAREAEAAVETLSGAIVDGRSMVVIMDTAGALDRPWSASSDGGHSREGRFAAVGPSQPPGSWTSASRWTAHDDETVPCESGRLFFAGALFESDEATLRAHFEEYGPVASFKLFCLPDGRSRGMGICTFATSDAASWALEAGVEVDGWPLFLQEDSSWDAWPVPAEPARASRQARWPKGAVAAYGQPARPWWGTGRDLSQRYSPYGEAAPLPPDAVDPQKTVFFSNASFETGEKAILDHFEEVGRIRSFQLFTTPDGRSRGMGVVQYMNAVSAARAYYNLHGLALDGRPLVVTEYCP